MGPSLLTNELFSLQMDSSFKNISSSDKHETQIDQLDEEEELGCQSLNWIGQDDAGS